MSEQTTYNPETHIALPKHPDISNLDMTDSQAREWMSWYNAIMIYGQAVCKPATVE